MRLRILLCLLAVVALTSYAGDRHIVMGDPSSVRAAGDTLYIPGGTLAGGENAGLLEATINGDTLAGGARKNVNRVYALNQGQYYFQVANINVTNPTGTLTICGIPSANGTTKPIIILYPIPPATAVPANIVYGSIKCDGIHYQVMQINGNIGNAELFYCGTKNKAAQSLVINNCLFEFSNIDLFDCTNETGAIGGWPNGAKFRITNSYFRNLFHAGQWWGSRIYQCKHPIDTLWVENCTVTTGGLTFLQQNNLTDFMYVNHNTIINNKKYWLLSPYHKAFFCTNNIFVNQNWVGEDTNVTNSGQDPDKYFMSTINVDTNNITNGLTTQPKYWLGGDSTKFVPALGLNKIQIYISDNINYYDPLLSSGYYNNSKYVLTPPGSIPSYLNWANAGSGPWKIGNTPGLWMNSRTTALFAAYGPPNGGFIEKRTSVADPGMTTKAIFDASVVDSMARWNQNQWGDARFSTSGITASKYIYGDYSAKTLPGVVSGHPVDTITVGKAGISKFTDLTENFAQSTNLSVIDGLPIGALIWDDAKLAAYNSTNAWNAVYNKYIAEGGLTSVQVNAPLPNQFTLSQNYPNPFNPTTTIEFSLPRQSVVDLKVYNILGQEVATLVHETLASGPHSVRFDATNLATGTYIFRLTAGDFTSSKKMVLLK